MNNEEINNLINNFTKAEEQYIEKYVCNQEIINIKNNYNSEINKLKDEIVNSIKILQLKLQEEYWKIFNYSKDKNYDRKLDEFNWIFMGKEFDLDIPCGEYANSRCGINIEISNHYYDGYEREVFITLRLNINNPQDSFLTEYGREKIINEYIKKFKNANKKHYLTKEEIKAEKIKKLELEIEKIKNS